MRILLLGEYSSFHKFLKDGLLELGNDVVLAGNGDSWKKIGGNDTFLFDDSHTGLRRFYDLKIEPFINMNRFSGYDIVQFINPYLFSKYINGKMIKEISKRNGLTSLMSCGYDYAYYQAYKKGAFRYCSLSVDKPRMKFFDNKTIKGRINIRDYFIATEKADIIIPMSYEYAVGFNENTKLHPVIPQAFNVKDIVYKDNICKGKVNIFHGINKGNYILKGTDIIIKALRRIKEKYPNDIEVTINNPEPYSQYVESMMKANIVVDQCYSYGYGLNACIALSQGKVVMSGNTKENRSSLGVKSCPIIDIEPSVDSICNSIEQLLEYRNMFIDFGYRGRRYVEEVHDHILIAEKFCKAWREKRK